MSKTSPYYKWYILALSMLTFGSLAGLIRLCMPVLFKQISIDLNLSIAEIGTIWGMDPLAGAFIALPAGLIVDRFGVKRTLVVICIFAGVFGSLRGLSSNFATLAAFMFLFGLIVATLPSITPKTTTQWFDKRQLGLTNAVLNVSWGIGAMTATMFSATVFSPLLGGWRNVLFVYGAPPIILGLLWLFTGREPEKNESQTPSSNLIPFRQTLSVVIRIKEVWFIGFIELAYWGATMGLNGYIPLYLRNIGWSSVNADSVITALMGVTAAGTIPMVLLSDRLGSRRSVLILSLITMSVSLALIPMVDATVLWILIVVSGFIRAGMAALFSISIFETKGIGSKYGGTALGLASALGMLGAFLGPPIGNNLASFGDGVPFFLWAFLAILPLPLFFFIKTS